MCYTEHSAIFFPFESLSQSLLTECSRSCLIPLSASKPACFCQPSWTSVMVLGMAQKDDWLSSVLSLRIKSTIFINIFVFVSLLQSSATCMVEMIVPRGSCTWPVVCYIGVYQCDYICPKGKSFSNFQKAPDQLVIPCLKGLFLLILILRVITNK